MNPSVYIQRCEETHSIKCSSMIKIDFTLKRLIAGSMLIELFLF